MLDLKGMADTGDGDPEAGLPGGDEGSRSATSAAASAFGAPPLLDGRAFLFQLLQKSPQARPFFPHEASRRGQGHHHDPAVAVLGPPHPFLPHDLIRPTPLRAGLSPDALPFQPFFPQAQPSASSAGVALASRRGQGHHQDPAVSALGPSHPFLPNDLTRPPPAGLSPDPLLFPFSVPPGFPPGLWPPPSSLGFAHPRIGADPGGSPGPFFRMEDQRFGLSTGGFSQLPAAPLKADVGRIPGYPHRDRAPAKSSGARGQERSSLRAPPGFHKLPGDRAAAELGWGSASQSFSDGGSKQWKAQAESPRGPWPFEQNHFHGDRRSAAFQRSGMAGEQGGLSGQAQRPPPMGQWVATSQSRDGNQSLGKGKWSQTEENHQPHPYPYTLPWLPPLLSPHTLPFPFSYFRSDFFRGHHVSSEQARELRRGIACRPDVDDEFTPTFHSIWKSLVPAPNEKAKQEQLLWSLRKFINKEWPSAQLCLYGSCANSFAFSNSDIDVCLAIADQKMEKMDILLKLADILQSGDFQNVQAITQARVPIVKLMDPVTGLSCDISVNNLLAVVNTKLIKDYAQIDERVRQLAFLVKHWARSRRVNETYQGTLSSYAYVLMCIHFLQLRRPAILPCLQAMNATYIVEVDNTPCAYFDRVEELQISSAQNKESIAQLLWAFFHYWAYQHDYAENVISVRTGSFLSKKAKGWKIRMDIDSHLICIEDPFLVSRDLGGAVDKHSIKILRWEFERAADILQYDTNPSVTLFAPYIPA